jgi:hypothetical protein
MGRILTLAASGAAALAIPTRSTIAQAPPAPIFTGNLGLPGIGSFLVVEGPTPVHIAGTLAPVGPANESRLTGVAIADAFQLGSSMQAVSRLLPGLVLGTTGNALSSVHAFDLVFAGPPSPVPTPPTPIAVSMRFALDGNITRSHSFLPAGSVLGGEVRLDVSIGGHLQRGGLVYNFDPTLFTGLFDDAHTTPGMFTSSPLQLGASGTVTTDPVIVLTDVPTTLEVELSAKAGTLGFSTTGEPLDVFVMNDFSHTLTFPTSGPVFDLPAGYTANSPSLHIVDNRFVVAPTAVPEPTTALLLGAGLAALGAGAARRRRR